MAESCEYKSDRVLVPKEGVRWGAGTDCNAGTVVRVSKSGKTVYVVEDKSVLLNGPASGANDALHFEPGGFVGHTSGTQRHAFEPGTGRELKFTARVALGGKIKLAGASSRGSMRSWGILYHGRAKHYDYNF